MTRVIVDADLLHKLLNLSQPLEFCTESGNILGTFTPRSQCAAAMRSQPEISDEELRRRAQGDGYSTDEIIAHLESL